MNIKDFYIEVDNDFVWKLFLLLCVIGLIIASSDVAFASGDAAGSKYDVIGDTLCRLIQNLSGNIARGIATMAIFSVGVGLFLGKLNWGVAAATAAGVGVIFSAGRLVNFIAGSAADNAVCPSSS
jgi:type IV secretory pathway VirB2 component (pilin)